MHAHTHCWLTSGRGNAHGLHCMHTHTRHVHACIAVQTQAHTEHCMSALIPVQTHWCTHAMPHAYIHPWAHMSAHCTTCTHTHCHTNTPHCMRYKRTHKASCTHTPAPHCAVHHTGCAPQLHRPPPHTAPWPPQHHSTREAHPRETPAHRGRLQTQRAHTRTDTEPWARAGCRLCTHACTHQHSASSLLAAWVTPSTHKGAVRICGGGGCSRGALGSLWPLLSVLWVLSPANQPRSPYSGPSGGWTGRYKPTPPTSNTPMHMQKVYTDPCIGTNMHTNCMNTRTTETHTPTRTQKCMCAPRHTQSQRGGRELEGPEVQSGAELTRWQLSFPVWRWRMTGDIPGDAGGKRSTGCLLHPLPIREQGEGSVGSLAELRLHLSNPADGCLCPCHH